MRSAILLGDSQCPENIKILKNNMGVEDRGEKVVRVHNEDAFSAMVSQIDNVLNSDEDYTRNFIDRRLGELQEGAKKVNTISHMVNNHHEGFLIPTAEIKRTPFLDGFRINDPEIYSLLISTVKEFKQMPGWQSKTTREIMPSAITTCISRYFGNIRSDGNTEGLNQEFYLNHSSVDSESINLSNLKDRKIAMCAEKAALAQNLLAFVGLQPEMIMAECELTPGTKEMHAYNLVHTSKGYFLFDPTNPKIYYDKDSRIVNYHPSIYPISSDQYEQINSGQKIEVTHVDNKQDEAGDWKSIEVKRIYGG
jgi:hypothetical protein